MEEDSPPDDPLRHPPDRTTSSTNPLRIPLTTVFTANENWRGKNDPAERRRIQNRLNQRAFRQRQRAGDTSASASASRPRSISGPASRPSRRRVRRDEPASDVSSPVSEAESVASSLAAHSEPRSASAPVQPSLPPPPPLPPPAQPPLPPGPPQGQLLPQLESQAILPDAFNPDRGRIWDELGQLINRNFMAAAVANAQHLGLDPTALRAGTPVRTPALFPLDPSRRARVPAALVPVDLQHRVPHDPILDILPHPRLRHNILSAAVAGRVNADAVARGLRLSGTLEESQGAWQRNGVVVWSAPEHFAGWELSESFLRRWGRVLLVGCADLIDVTNAWRSRRGERLFALPLPVAPAPLAGAVAAGPAAAVGRELAKGSLTTATARTAPPTTSGP